MAYNYSGSSWDALTYKSKSGGYKLKASAARDGATIQGAYDAFGAPTGKLAGQITGYNPNLIKTDTKLATSLGMAPDSKGVTGTGAVQPTNLGVMAGASPSYAPVKPAPAPTPVAKPATTPVPAPAPVPSGGTKTLQSVTSMAQLGVMAPASPAAAGLPTTGVMATTTTGPAASTAKSSLTTWYESLTPSQQSYYQKRMSELLAKEPNALDQPSSLARLAQVQTEIAGGAGAPSITAGPTSSYLNASAPLPTTGTYQPAMATPIATAQKPMGSTFVDPTTGKTLYSDGKGLWLTSAEYTRLLANSPGMPTVQQAAAGGVIDPGQTYSGPISNKVISEGGANISSGAQIPAATNDGSTYAPGSSPYPTSTPISPATGQQPGGTTTAGGVGQPAGGQGGTPLVVNPDPTGQAPGSTPTNQGAGATITATDAEKAAIAAALAGPQLGVMGPASAPPAFVDPYGTQANPYDEAYQRRLAGQAVDNAEQQYGIMARRIRENAGDSGMGTRSGAYLGAMNDLAMDTAAARTRGMNDAMLTTADHRANYGQQWNQGKLSSQRDQFDRWRTTEMMPYEMQQAVAQVENLVQVGRINAVQAEAAKQVLDNQGWTAFIEFVAKLAPAAGAVLGIMA